MRQTILADMGIRWKLKEFLQQEGVSAYALAAKTHGRLSQTGVYRLTAEDLAGVRFDSLEAIIPALRELTGKEVRVGDILEYEVDDNGQG